MPLGSQRSKEFAKALWICGSGFALLVLLALTYWYYHGSQPYDLARVLLLSSIISYFVWAFALLFVVVLLLFSAKAILTQKITLKFRRRASASRADDKRCELIAESGVNHGNKTGN